MTSSFMKSPFFFKIVACSLDIRAACIVLLAVFSSKNLNFYVSSSPPAFPDHVKPEIQRARGRDSASGRDSAARRDPSIFLRPEDILCAVRRRRNWDDEFTLRCVAVVRRRATACQQVLAGDARVAAAPLLGGDGRQRLVGDVSRAREPTRAAPVANCKEQPTWSKPLSTSPKPVSNNLGE
jgi:hypothetical protein